jgi:hypothetical protein
MTIDELWMSFAGSEVKSPNSISSVNRELKRKFQTNLTSRKYKCKANFTENFAPVNGFKKNNPEP